MKKLLIAGALVVAGSYCAQAQQLGQFSQYVQNPMILNPAATGIYNYTDINLSMRRQWSGFVNAPQTYYLSVNSKLNFKGNTPLYKPSLRTSQMPDASKKLSESNTGKLKHGLGGYLMSDEYGAFTKLSGKLSYALHLPLSQSINLSFGVGLGASNLAFDQSKVTLENQTDNTYMNFIANGTASTFFDINAGFRLYSDDFFIGYASNQLLGDKVAFGTGIADADLQIHHFISAGYSIGAGEDFKITPSVMVKLMPPAPVSFDVNLKVEYLNMVWAGLSYRYEDAVVGMVGFTFSDFIKLGYSYDFTLSNIKQSSSGSHEVLLGIMLGKK
jgi:type IX secretion system PorP/SprF family membrane protein